MKDWFRKATWAAQDRYDFETRLQRARPAGRPQYLRIQAEHLAQSGSPELLTVALDLVDRIVKEYPDSLEIATAQHLKARCHEQLGNTILAADAYRATMEAQRRMPHVRTDAHLDFAWLVANRDLTSLHQEAAAILEETQDGCGPSRSSGSSSTPRERCSRQGRATGWRLRRKLVARYRKLKLPILAFGIIRRWAW